MTSKKASYSIFGFLLAFCFLFLGLAKTEASSFSLGIYPPVIQIRAEPPADISTPIVIKNLADETSQLQIIFRPFTASGEESNATSYPLFQNVQIIDDGNKVDSFILAPKQQKTLILHIDIPQNYTKSDYYFSVIFLSKGTGYNKSTQSQILGGVATNILLSVGGSKAKGSLVEFSAPFLATKGPLPFTVKIKNSGNHFITPHGYILIKNILGQTVEKINLIPVNVLANSTRSIPSINQLRQNVSNHSMEINDVNKAYWPEAIILGPYTATLSISLSNNGPNFTKTLFFIGVPIAFILKLAIALLIVFFLVNRVITKLSK